MLCGCGPAQLAGTAGRNEEERNIVEVKPRTVSCCFAALRPSSDTVMTPAPRRPFSHYECIDFQSQAKIILTYTHHRRPRRRLEAPRGPFFFRGASKSGKTRVLGNFFGATPHLLRKVIKPNYHVPRRLVGGFHRFHGLQRLRRSISPLLPYFRLIATRPPLGPVPAAEGIARPDGHLAL